MTVLDSIRDTADELTDPHLHVEKIREWDGNRNPKWRHHKTVQPGLLTQLQESVYPVHLREDGGRSIPASRPPLALEALSQRLAITNAVTRWCWSLKLDKRGRVESDIRQLAAAAMAFDDETARTLLAEMRQWRTWCAVYTGWETIYQPAAVPCPVVDCGQTNTLRINLTNKTATCRACRSVWDEEDGSVFVLADYVRTTTSDAASA